MLFYQKGANKSSCARMGGVGQTQHKTRKIFPDSPFYGREKGKGFGGKEFCPPGCLAKQDKKY